MSKQFINEVSRMKDLFGYKRGVVISEQDNQLQKIDDDYLNTKPTGNPDENHGLRQCNTSYNGPCNSIWDGYIKNYVGEDLWVKKFGKVPDLVGDKDNKPKTEQPEQPTSTQRTNYLSPLELKQNVGNKTGVQAFQDWLDTTHSGWHPKYQTLNGNVPKGYGKFGPNTNTAWIKYKKEYLEKNPNLAADVKTIPLTPTTAQSATAQSATAQSATAQPETPQLANATPKNPNLSLAASTTPENYYNTLYGKGLIQGEPSEDGENRIRYRGPELSAEQQELLTKAMDGKGYEFARKGNDKRLVYKRK